MRDEKRMPPPSPELIARLREATGLSFRKFADEMGTDWSTIYRWETGKSRPQGVNKIMLWRKIREVLDDDVTAHPE